MRPLLVLRVGYMDRYDGPDTITSGGAYIEANGVLVNPLVEEGYPSIGCAPCTTKPAEGADPRSGRWQGLNKTECGLHAS